MRFENPGREVGFENRERYLYNFKRCREGGACGETEESHCPSVFSEVGEVVFGDTGLDIVDVDNGGLYIRNYLKINHRRFLEGQSLLDDKTLFRSQSKWLDLARQLLSLGCS